MASQQVRTLGAVIGDSAARKEESLKTDAFRPGILKWLKIFWSYGVCPNSLASRVLSDRKEGKVTIAADLRRGKRPSRCRALVARGPRRKRFRSAWKPETIVFNVHEAGASNAHVLAHDFARLRQSMYPGQQTRKYDRALLSSQTILDAKLERDIAFLCPPAL